MLQVHSVHHEKHLVINDSDERELLLSLGALRVSTVMTQDQPPYDRAVGSAAGGHPLCAPGSVNEAADES